MDVRSIQKILNINELGELKDGFKIINRNKYYETDEYLIIEVSENKFIITDNLQLVKNYFTNYIFNINDSGYATTDIYKKKKRLHRLIMGVDDKRIIDHINRLRFDNRKQNLRITTSSINNRNKKKQINNVTGFIGVEFSNTTKFIRAYVNDNNNKRLSKSFPIKKNGIMIATRDALIWRHEQALIYGYI